MRSSDIDGQIACDLNEFRKDHGHLQVGHSRSRCRGCNDICQTSSGSCNGKLLFALSPQDLGVYAEGSLSGR